MLSRRVRRGGVLLVVVLLSNCGSSPSAPEAQVPNAAGSIEAQGAEGGTAALGADSSAPDAKPDAWQRRALGEMPVNWASRDGAGMVQLATGRILMVGGWNPDDPWGPLGGNGNNAGGDRSTNEVWKSDDLGVSWQLLLPHDAAPPTAGSNARFPPVHTVGLVLYNGHAVLIGNDPNDGLYSGDVWHESNNGATWTRVATTSPAVDRTFFMCGNYKGAIYVMGGQRLPHDPTTALNDVWRSADGGLTWARLPDALWSPRGLVYRPVEHAGRLVIVGGGLYADDPYVPEAFNGVFAFDGTTWKTLLPDGHKQFTATFYNPVVSLAGRLWLFNGYDPANNVELSRATVSDDDGSTWTTFAGGSGGPESHADAVVATQDRILRLSGNIQERTVWEFTP